MGWKKGKLFEWGVVGWEQELMGRHSTRSCSFCLAGRGRHREILPRSATELVSVLCMGNAISVETSCSSCSLLQYGTGPCASAAGRRVAGRTARSWRWWKGVRLSLGLF